MKESEWLLPMNPSRDSISRATRNPKNPLAPNRGFPLRMDQREVLNKNITFYNILILNKILQ